MKENVVWLMWDSLSGEVECVVVDVGLTVW